MKLSISNFAWNFSENDFAFNILNKHGIKNIEGVLTKINDWKILSVDDVVNFKRIMDSYGVVMESVQSIFYGVKCDGLHDKKIVIPHIERLIGFSKILGVKVLILGSPNLRRKNLEWESELSDTFKTIDSMLENTGIEMSIEPNTKSYGGDYFYTLTQIVDFINMNNLHNIKTMIDTHNLISEGLDPCDEIVRYYQKINHIHISEPNLTPIQNFEFHNKFSEVIKSLKYDKIITYELLKCENFDECVDVFKKIYYYLQ